MPEVEARRLLLNTKGHLAALCPEAARAFLDLHLHTYKPQPPEAHGGMGVGLLS